MVRHDQEQVTEFYAVYRLDDGTWRIWDTKNDAPGEPFQPKNYATKVIAVIVANSLEHPC